MTTITVLDGTGATQTIAKVADTGSTTDANSLPVAFSTEGKAQLAALATAAAQTTGNASLASIDSKTPALVSGAVPVLVGNTVPVSGAFYQATQPVSIAATVSTSDTTVQTGLGAPADSVATTDTGTFSLIALFKRLLQASARPTTFNSKTGTVATPGWQSGNPASLAVGATVNCWFDLGTSWDRWRCIHLFMDFAGSTGTTVVQYFCNDSISTTGMRRHGPAFATGTGSSYDTITDNNGTQEAMILPSGRYLNVQCSGQATAALSSTANITAVAHPQY